MRRGFHTYLAVAVALLGVGGLAAALVAQSGVAAPSGQHGASARSSAATRAGLAKTLTGYLRRRRFQVNPGYPMVASSDVCAKYSYPALQDCWGNNPVSPYVVAVVKAWSDEHAGPTPVNVFGPVRAGYTPLFRFNPRDAIVIYGRMPPLAKYMSVLTWVWSQPGHWKAKDYNKWASNPLNPYPMRYLFTTIPPNDPKANRTFSFSTFGDAVNNVVMQRRSGSPFGKNRYFIIAPSATTDRAVRRALQAQGVPNSYIFTEQIPRRDKKFGPIGPLGMGKSALDFFTFFTLAIPDNPQAAQRWWANLPLTVLRVRAPSSLGPVKRYEFVHYDKRTAHSEAYLAGDMHNLVNAVCQRTSSTLKLTSVDCTQPPPATSTMVEITQDLGLRGPYCLSINMWCGERNDTDFFGTRSRPLDSGQVYAVVDTLATETGNATYVGLSVNDASTFLAPTGVTDTALNGSADAYASTVNNTGKFFVHYFTRNCGVLEPLLGQQRLAQDCTSITTKLVPALGDNSAVGHPELKGMFFPVIRDYIAPGTARAPDATKMLRPRILAFIKP